MNPKIDADEILNFFKGNFLTKKMCLDLLEENEIGFYNPQTDIFNMLRVNEKTDKIMISDIDKIFRALGETRMSVGEKGFMMDILDFDSDGKIGMDDFKKFYNMIFKGQNSGKDFMRTSLFNLDGN